VATVATVGGLADGVAQRRGRIPGRGWLVARAGCVKADDGVEVDDAACLVFGDLDVTDTQHGAQFFLRDPSQSRQVAGQVGGEPAPQVPGVGVEQDGSLVVVAVEAQRLAEPGVLVHVAGWAGNVTPVRAATRPSVTARAARQHGLAAHPAGVDRPEGGGGEGGEHARMRRDGVGDALAAAHAHADELAGVALVDG